MTPVTEVVLLTLVPNADYNLIIESAKILAQQPGCLAVRTSRLHQDSDKVHYFIDWDSVESHQAFAFNDEVYYPFRELVGTVMAAYAQPYHVALSPYPPAALNHHQGQGSTGKSKIAVVAQAWFPGGDGFTPELAETVSRAFEAFTAALPDGFSGEVASGWSLEDIRRKDELSRVFFFALGWESFDAYLRFRDEDRAKGVFALITKLKGLRGLDFHLVSTESTVA
jgi:hypothetical protein